MGKHSELEKEIKVLGIDLAKQSFQVHGVNDKGVTVLRRNFSREKLFELVVRLKPCLIGMEACGGAHYFARKFKEYGHDARLMAPQFVKPYVKSNKSDALDAEAICEAVQRPTMRFVPIKALEQQDLQSLHRIRDMAIAHRTALVNQIRGLLAEYGVVLPQGISQIRNRLVEILDDPKNELTDKIREYLGELREHLRVSDERINSFNTKIHTISEQIDSCRRLKEISGIGPLTATALVATAGNAGVFKNGREMAAWIGLVPKQHSTGGKERLLGISKRGDTYLRKLLIQGAHATIRFASKKDDPRSRWLMSLVNRRGKCVAAVALANKNARTAWALLSKGETYRPAKAV